jgi:opacity protein-like surface antigen
MKRILLATAAAAVFATPALARDGAPYVGVEAGVLIPRDAGPSGDFDRRFPGGEWVDFLNVDHDLGFDADLIGGYDFGMFRLEGELAYKRAKHKRYNIDENAPGPFPGGGAEPVVPGATISADGRTSVTSGMINALIDIGNDEGFNFYAGGGIGVARVSMTIDRIGDMKLHLKDTDLPAWQLVAGVRTPITDTLDAGLKYRFFSAGTLKSDLFGVGFDGRSSFQSHSILASLIYNFAPPSPPPPAAPPPPSPPPPPPPPPATQTCPDGTVILATASCPVPPPPPPPPPPAPERG